MFAMNRGEKYEFLANAIKENGGAMYLTVVSPYNDDTEEETTAWLHDYPDSKKDAESGKDRLLLIVDLKEGDGKFHFGEVLCSLEDKKSLIKLFGNQAINIDLYLDDEDNIYLSVVGGYQK